MNLSIGGTFFGIIIAIICCCYWLCSAANDSSEEIAETGVDSTNAHRRDDSDHRRRAVQAVANGPSGSTGTVVFSIRPPPSAPPQADGGMFTVPGPRPPDVAASADESRHSLHMDGFGVAQLPPSYEDALLEPPAYDDLFSRT